MAEMGGDGMGAAVVAALAAVLVPPWLCSARRVRLAWRGDHTRSGAGVHAAGCPRAAVPVKVSTN